MLLRAFGRFDPLNARELLAAAARLLRTLTGPVSADEFLGSLDLDRLSRRGLFRRGFALGALARIRRVATAVLHDRALLERERATRNAIEKPPVVR